jgi:hypothetical protein
VKKTLIISSMVLVSSYSVARVSCGDFSTQQQAQSYFENHRAGNLDRDHDGIACESLPRGSSSSYSETHVSKPKKVVKIVESKPVPKVKAHVEEKEVVVPHNTQEVKKAKKKKLKIPFVPVPVVEAEEETSEKVTLSDVNITDENVTQKIPLNKQDISILDKILGSAI